MQRDKIFNYFASFQHISSSGEKQFKLKVVPRQGGVWCVGCVGCALKEEKLGGNRKDGRCIAACFPQCILNAG